MTQDIYRRPAAGQHPLNLSPEYKSTSGRSPRQPAVVLPQSLSEITGPLLATERLDALENDLTKQRSGEPLGERIDFRFERLDFGVAWIDAMCVRGDVLPGSRFSRSRSGHPNDGDCDSGSP